MTGLEKIINRIQEEADAAAAGRLEAAKAEADRILAEARTVCDSVDAETTEKITAMKASYDSRVASSAEQSRKLALLRAKQEIIAEVLEEALERLRKEDTAGYFLNMEKILKKYVLPEDGEIYFSAKDLERMPDGFEKKIQAAAREKGGSLVLQKEPKDIADGFLLVYGGVEENCTWEALMDAKKDRLQSGTAVFSDAFLLRRLVKQIIDIAAIQCFRFFLHIIRCLFFIVDKQNSFSILVQKHTLFLRTLIHLLYFTSKNLNTHINLHRFIHKHNPLQPPCHRVCS